MPKSPEILRTKEAILKTSFTPRILRNLTLAQPKGLQIDPQNVMVFVTRLEAQGPTGEWINFGDKET